MGVTQQVSNRLSVYSSGFVAIQLEACLNFCAYEGLLRSKHPKHLIENPTVCTNESLHAYKSLDTCNYVLRAGRDVSLMEY